MYAWMVRAGGSRVAGVVMTVWYAALFLTLLLFSGYAGEGDFLYLNL